MVRLDMYLEIYQQVQDDIKDLGHETDVRGCDGEGSVDVGSLEKRLS